MGFPRRTTAPELPVAVPGSGGRLRGVSESETPAAAGAVAHPEGIGHVRLTVTDARRSKAFYGWLLGENALRTDFTHLSGDPSVRDDPDRVYGGCSFTVGRQVLGLRPVAPAGDRFDPDRVGLDHLALTVGSRAELEAAAERLAAAGVEHGEVTDLPGFRVTILSVQDPDGINLELSAPLQP
ncbi:VOC family protein [Quadrisphaera sp. RL12-1S]|nr:VOC family protein [Quadrisphaera sp. RL12-1S]MBC3763331.1 VOC family protein [Quadrisphaera sp. RL12-1S]